MIATLVVLILAAGPEPVKVAAPGLSIVNLKPELREFLTEHLAQELSKHGVQVVTPKQIETILGLERQKELLGCAEGNSCAVELANALGVDALLTGEIGKLGEQIQVNLKVISPVNTKQLAAWTGRVAGEGELFDALATGATVLAGQLFTALGREAPVGLSTAAPPPPASSLRKWSWLPIAAGAISAGVGLGFVADAYGVAAYMRSTGQPLAERDIKPLRERGETSQTVGWSAIGVGAAAIAAGATMFVIGAPAQVQTSFAPIPGGGAVSVRGSFP